MELGHEVLQKTASGLVRDESADIVGDSRSAVIDAANTAVSRGLVVKVLAWYDNEWGYAARLIDLARYVSTRS